MRDKRLADQGNVYSKADENKNNYITLIFTGEKEQFF